MDDTSDKYLTITCLGYKVYSDVLIASHAGGYTPGQPFHSKLLPVLLGLVGTPAQVEAVSANLYQHTTLTMRGRAEGEPLGGTLHSHGTGYRAAVKKTGPLVHKIVRASQYLWPHQTRGEERRSGVVFGPDLATVKARAFTLLDRNTMVPLLPGWIDWLWEEVLNPQRLYSFGSEQVRESWMVSWSSDEELESLVLEAVSGKYLQ